MNVTFSDSYTDTIINTNILMTKLSTEYDTHSMLGLLCELINVFLFPLTGFHQLLE
jgi:hypothetical protein